MSAFVFVVEPDVVHDQIAATPETLGLLIAALGPAEQASPFGPEAYLRLPLVADPDLPLGEVHMRRVSPVPYTRAEQDEVLRTMLGYVQGAGFGGGQQ